jgi:hypothetical protein
LMQPVAASRLPIAGREPIVKMRNLRASVVNLFFC